jgi:ribosomal protein L7Ae-like RNA K-turn-binding protein
MDIESKIITLLGFANKAGKLTIGKQAVLKALYNKRVYQIVLSNDVSLKTIKELQRLNAEWFQCAEKSKADLGAMAGRNELSIVAVSDQQFAKSIRKLLSQM